MKKFISELKKILIKNKTNAPMYYVITKLKMIKIFHYNKMGTYLSCAHFIFGNFEKIKYYISELSSNDYAFFKDLIFDNVLPNKLAVASKHIFIVNGIKDLEAEGLTIRDLSFCKNKLFNNLLLKHLNEIELKNLIYCFSRTLYMIRKII